jgi:hypothetical protein
MRSPMTPDHLVALVANDELDRSLLEDHVRTLGFSVRPLAEFPSSASYQRVVICLGATIATDTARAIAAFLDHPARMVLVITRHPGVVREMGLAAHEQLRLLVPPVFPWQLREALGQGTP